MTITLTPATDADLPEIAALMNRAYRGGGAAAWNREGYIAGDRTNPALLREEMAAHPEAAQLVWRPDTGAPIRGTVRLAPKDDGVWALGSLAIDPEAQNGGAGRALLAAAEEWARAAGGAAIRMTVINIRAGLLAWYQRRGYALTDETEPFPYDDDRFGTPTRDDLHFVVLTKALG